MSKALGPPAGPLNALDRRIEPLNTTVSLAPTLFANVALNPSTSLSAVEWVLSDVDMVLLMTVNPGFGGQAFLPAMTGKIELLRSQLSRSGLPVDIQVDGGIKADNVAEVVRAGANVIVSGSGIFGTKDYAKTIARMKENIRKAASATA